MSPMFDTLDKIVGILDRKWNPERIQGISQRKDAEKRNRSNDPKKNKSDSEGASKERLIDKRA